MRVCAEAGVAAGGVDLACQNVISHVYAFGVDSGTGGDWLIVHVAAIYATIANVRHKDLILFRTRQLEAERALADLVHQTAMYHEDPLGGAKFARVVVSGASTRGAEIGERLRRGLEERMGAPVQPLDFRGAAAIRDRINAGPELLDALDRKSVG